MMRANPSSSMQKTYDECFLTCSTAVYFEGQNNEAEALRSWKSALDQIYYHNAYRVPSNYRPKTETDRALQESLRQLELQCKERVDLLETLKKSREDTAKDGTTPQLQGEAAGAAPIPPPHVTTATPRDAAEPTWLGGGTVPPIGFSDLSRPPLPLRPALQQRKSSGADSARLNSLPQYAGGQSLSPGPSGHRRESRTPSPEKKGRMLRTLRPGARDGSRPSSAKLPSSMRSRPPAAAKAATQAWGTNAAPSSSKPMYMANGLSRESLVATPPAAGHRASFEQPRTSQESNRPSGLPPDYELLQAPAPFYFRSTESLNATAYTVPPPENRGGDSDPASRPQVARKNLSSPQSQRASMELGRIKSTPASGTGLPAYRNEYPTTSLDARAIASSAATQSWGNLDAEKNDAPRRRPVQNSPKPSVPTKDRARKPRPETLLDTNGPQDRDAAESSQRPAQRKPKMKQATVRADLPPTPTSEAEGAPTSEDESDEWKERVSGIMKNLPRGVDESAARQILNDIVIQGDEVHWEDVAGLEIAKSALKENVVYPFLRPDLFMGLREPARGMLLFGPPGTGKTMLARAVATESRSTFFAISASSLTSKFLGESEKLVRALFSLAKMLAPSIIFVDEIDSLLSARSGSGEHEATRRIKTEFLIQWSDLAKAAAGREQSEKEKERGDASRVLVLAATNLPWAIDEAARRRFVRRQYIPLPEDHVRRTQLKTLMSHQKHELDEEDMDDLVGLTAGFSGSDITALAKDAAMGPLRSLGEKLLHMTMDEIRPIRFEDFRASLTTIRPSVSKQGLKEFEDWAREFGERGG
ncbi:AAA-domain-containing protein [Lophiostoma macrostomum CBS 122681]|uniref:AAA-domain-containing protein n=1 Tax=Lophiostoma macrostomum CBS 122681 TaxID=1314788 RepID=A0A6A6TFM2_9PLEO|nr:AAA-domain-containing protein [Lophiostoma macrostomum CBS 122681]